MSTKTYDAQDLAGHDLVVTVMGDTYDPPALVTRVDLSQHGEGWVWVCVVPRDSAPRWLRLGIYESVTVA